MDNELCKCGKVGKISCPHDDRCGIDNTQLPAEMLDKIKEDAGAYANGRLGDINTIPDYLVSKWDYLATGWENGATEYASKLHEAQQEIAQLKRWKTEAAELLNPILHYGQSKEAGIPLGESITAVVLERCKKLKSTMKHNIDLIKQIRDTYAKEEGYGSFANMARSINIVPRDIKVIAMRYAEAVDAALQAKCERYETALKDISNGKIIAVMIAAKALSAGEGEKEGENG